MACVFSHLSSLLKSWTPAIGRISSVWPINNTISRGKVIFDRGDSDVSHMVKGENILMDFVIIVLARGTS